jgi:hypothetical protein
MVSQPNHHKSVIGLACTAQPGRPGLLAALLESLLALFAGARFQSEAGGQAAGQPPGPNGRAAGDPMQPPGDDEDEDGDGGSGFDPWTGQVDPYAEQDQADEAAGVKDLGRGCVMGILFPIAFLVSGCILVFVFFAGDDASANSNRIIAILCLMAAVGTALGAWSFLRTVAPGVYLRGMFGLPDLPVTPRAAKPGMQDERGLKLFAGFVTLGLIYLLMLAAVALTMDTNEALGYRLLLIGLIAGPAAGILVMTRTALDAPLDEVIE